VERNKEERVNLKSTVVNTENWTQLRTNQGLTEEPKGFPSKYEGEINRKQIQQRHGRQKGIAESRRGQQTDNKQAGGGNFKNDHQ
jgi:hypothetical protein